MTVTTSIQVADSLVPNHIGEEIKRRWLGDLEGMVRVELMEEPTAEVADLTVEGVLPTDAPLTIPYPFDRLYWLYLVAMVEQTHGDTTRYANAAAMFNTVYASYAKWLKRGGV